MPQQSLDTYWGITKTPKEPQKTVAPQAPSSTSTVAVDQKKREHKRPPFPPVAPLNLPPSYFVSASYDGRQKKAVIKLYEPTSGQIYFWYDNTDHKPYCLTNLTIDKLSKFDRIVKHDGFYAFEKIKILFWVFY